MIIKFCLLSNIINDIHIIMHDESIDACMKQQ